jgi:hypothetical protein
MSHMIIIGGVIIFPPHGDGDGRSTEHASSIEFGDIKYKPAHGMSDAEVGDQVQKILKTLGKLGTVGD